MDPELSDILSALGKTGLQSHAAKAPASGRTRATSEKFDQEFGQLINSIGGGTRSSRSTTLKAETPLRPPSQSFSKEIEKIIQEFRTLSTKYSLGLSGVINIEGRLESSKSNYLSQSRIEDSFDAQKDDHTEPIVSVDSGNENHQQEEELPEETLVAANQESDEKDQVHEEQPSLQLEEKAENENKEQIGQACEVKEEKPTTEKSCDASEADEWIVNSSHESFSPDSTATISTSQEASN
eukprot:TRINITY_DN2096_c1_g1_i1.p1 TRINITY_DN2096_c1_g1~~TRINITY_DN2096_c1_g1_i1.p1  ORF type:complete len:239 (-),score=62.67 TRINITY_DN2096_c1_g1_i1:333-1049(-)